MKTVLSIGAHPDDIEIGCGGAELSFAERGYKIVHVVATLGEEGSSNLHFDETKKIRRAEALASAKILGAAEVFFLELPDGLTHFQKSDKIKLIEIIRQQEPEVIFMHSQHDQFPDHKIIFELSRSAILGAGGPWYPGATGKAHSPGAIYGFEVWNPINQAQHLIDVTKFMEQKITALREHRSQIEHVDYVRAVQGLASYRGALMGQCLFAEAFEVLKI